MCPVQPVPGRAHATVLVAEDEVLIRSWVADHLRDCGWNVLEAGSGAEARSLFLAGGSINVLFSAVQMSAATDGIELASWVHDNYPDVHVLLTSGVAAMAGIPTEVCPQASTFRKPYEREAVGARIRALLG